EGAARGLSGCLANLGLELGRLKTGTPPRLHRDSIDFARFEPQHGDVPAAAFSFLNEYGEASGRDGVSGYRGNGVIDTDTPTPSHPATSSPAWAPPLPQVCCYLGATNEAIHEIIRANLHRAPMYSGQIQSTGPRYCPSIEDKVVRFAEKPSHHIFL